MKHSYWIGVAIALAACATTQAVDIPPALDPPAGESLATVVGAKGVQIYECRARQDGSGFEWVFVAPEAELFDRFGRRVGTYGAGPFWQMAAASSAR